MGHLKSLIKGHLPKRVYFFLYRIYKYWEVFVLGRNTELSLVNFTKPCFRELRYGDIGFSLLIDPDNGTVDKEIFVHGKWEERNVDVIRKYVSSDSICLDVGANIGHHTLVMASIAKTGRVHAFEPLPNLCRQIERSLRENSVDNVVVHGYGLSDRSYEADISVDLLNIGKTTLDAQRRGSRLETVSIRRFDEIWNVDDKISFVKMDVEGHEYQALKGMGDMLKRDHPVILFEYSPVFYNSNGTDGREMLSFIFDMGYVILKADDLSGKIYSTPQEVMKDFEFQTDLLCISR